jgi:nucleoside-diphosphate-sugar epimerase
VIGLARTEAGRSTLEKMGAGAVVVNALDADGIVDAVHDAGPEAIVDLLTAIPPGGPMRASDMEQTNRLRTRGTEYLLRAAIAAGAKRFIAESMILAYGFGDHGERPITEEGLVPPIEQQARTKDTVDALLALEDQVIRESSNHTIEGVILRFGVLYGPGVPATESNLQGLRRRKIPAVQGGPGSLSWIHIQDAVSAIVAALERGRSGEAYNIVDDEPAGYRDFLLYAAEVIGSPRPRNLPLWFLRLTAPYAAAFLSTRLHVSNEKAKRELKWSLRFSSYREGLRDMADRAGREKKAA